VLKLVKFEARKMGWIGFVRVDGVVKDVPGHWRPARLLKHCWSLAMTDIDTNMDRCCDGEPLGLYFLAFIYMAC
jgi:hypothetical protein